MRRWYHLISVFMVLAYGCHVQGMEEPTAPTERRAEIYRRLTQVALATGVIGVTLAIAYIGSQTSTGSAMTATLRQGGSHVWDSMTPLRKRIIGGLGSLGSTIAQFASSTTGMAFIVGVPLAVIAYISGAFDRLRAAPVEDVAEAQEEVEKKFDRNIPIEPIQQPEPGERSIEVPLSPVRLKPTPEPIPTQEPSPGPSAEEKQEEEKRVKQEEETRSVEPQEKKEIAEREAKEHQAAEIPEGFQRAVEAIMPQINDLKNIFSAAVVAASVLPAKIAQNNKSCMDIDTAAIELNKIYRASYDLRKILDGLSKKAAPCMQEIEQLKSQGQAPYYTVMIDSMRHMQLAIEATQLTIELYNAINKKAIATIDDTLSRLIAKAAEMICFMAQAWAVARTLLSNDELNQLSMKAVFDFDRSINDILPKVGAIIKAITPITDIPQSEEAQAMTQAILNPVNDPEGGFRRASLLLTTNNIAATTQEMRTVSKSIEQGIKKKIEEAKADPQGDPDELLHAQRDTDRFSIIRELTDKLASILVDNVLPRIKQLPSFRPEERIKTLQELGETILSTLENFVKSKKRTGILLHKDLSLGSIQKDLKDIKASSQDPRHVLAVITARVARVYDQIAGGYDSLKKEYKPKSKSSDDPEEEEGE